MSDNLIFIWLIAKPKLSRSRRDEHRLETLYVCERECMYFKTAVPLNAELITTINRVIESQATLIKSLNFS